MDLCGFLICVAFCLVSGPFLCCFTVFSAGETQIWPGDVRVVAFAVFLFVVCFSMVCLVCAAKGFILFANFSSSLTVRTEP